MSVRLPNGATIAIVSTYGALATMSAVTNAAPPHATLGSGHGVTAGEFLEITSGWPKLNSLILEAGTVATNDVILLGVDTTDTTKYPAAGGVGSVRAVTAWQTITQVTDLSTSGGDQQFATYEFLDSDDQFQIPTVRSPQSLTLTIADDTTQPHYALILAASNDRLQRALKLTLPSGSIIVYNAYITLNPTPTLSKGNIMTLTVTASLLAQPVRY